MSAAAVKVCFFSTKPYDEEFFGKTLAGNPGLVGSAKVSFSFRAERLTMESVQQAAGHDAVCIFVNDTCNAEVLKALHALGVRVVLLRCAGFNNVDATVAAQLGIAVLRVPRYSPHAVAEHAVSLLCTLTRRIHRGSNRVKEHNFALNGLIGFDIYKRTVGVIGTGAIGKISAGILHGGFGCRVLAYDPHPDKAWARKTGVEYVSKEELMRQAMIITLHVPLSPETKHIINAQSLRTMPQGVTIINTSRGALVDTKALIEALRSGHVAAYGADVYENEAAYFFEDKSNAPIADAMLADLIAFPNVILTGHQAFFTEEALGAISSVTLGNLGAFLAGKGFSGPNYVPAPKPIASSLKPRF